jgi:hypothetical protein
MVDAYNGYMNILELAGGTQDLKHLHALTGTILYDKLIIRNLEL